ncbi:hypothetical protein LSH36_320g04000 [Paralvinella palmiformis]|uniref:Death domain-containing protein n=1 Tax=Paralvinella palmiformis TaxID=53620 RepID=A0AAD9N0L7_9ANNE|nr:hypothetical protein LSH36_320g04000 [Paralvinella palmiformis]
MGQISSNFLPESDVSLLPEDLTPDKANWITAHAVAAKLSIVEVERLWKRFQQLGCNTHGELATSDFQKHEIASDIFAKNILTALKSPSGRVEFLTFLNCAKWAESSPYNDKITAIFYLLNAGETINRQLLMRLVKRVYPGEKKARYDHLADVLMEQLGCERDGNVTLEEFIEQVNLLPRETLDQLFTFLIVPNVINEEAHKTFSRLSNHPPTDVIPQDNQPDISSQTPTDGLLHQIAAKVCKDDWHLLANQLGFTASAINKFEKDDAKTPEGEVFAMLVAWRQKGGPSATCGVLEDKLHACNMNGAAMLLYP